MRKWHAFIYTHRPRRPVGGQRRWSSGHFTTQVSTLLHTLLQSWHQTFPHNALQNFTTQFTTHFTTHFTAHCTTPNLAPLLAPVGTFAGLDRDERDRIQGVRQSCRLCSPWSDLRPVPSWRAPNVCLSVKRLRPVPSWRAPNVCLSVKRKLAKNFKCINVEKYKCIKVLFKCKNI
jgi:hypothetical protein